MKTHVIHVDPLNPDPSQIALASNIITTGGLVAFPTETVYGLGANALDAIAINKIFVAKGRPSDNPLIVHVSSIDMVYDITRDLPSAFFNLTAHFWPGPLTLIVPKRDILPNNVTGSQPTVGIRMPNNAVALELIKRARCPIAAPSANLSGKPSPTSANHVLMDLNGKINMLLDGGSCAVGIESTVLDLTTPLPTIYRPGKITVDEISELLPNVILYQPDSSVSIPKSPGLKYRHYAPSSHVVLVHSKTDEEMSDKIAMYLRDRSISRKKCCVLSGTSSLSKLRSLLHIDVLDLGDSSNLYEVASSLFGILRKCDELKYDYVFFPIFPNTGIGSAVMDRLTRASSEILL